MDINIIKQIIENGSTYLGIELGSTRIKGVLIDENGECISSGAYDWENKLVNGIWTYSLDDVWTGIQTCYKALADNVHEKYGVTITKIGAIGFSAMMHGYLPFDKDGNQLCEFRTWRNTITGKAAKALTDEFGFNIPERWSIAHLYQAVLNNESHVKDIAFLTTLAGYVHYSLTGEKVMGIGEASGMFPIDSNISDYDNTMLNKFDTMTSSYNFEWKLNDILPKVLQAGENAGYLTEKGAWLLDTSGNLQAGIPFCAPEGDAGTGMVATNSVAVRTGNVSAGTSVFAMIVLEKALSAVYSQIDVVTTPTGHPVAMVHCNNCSSEIDAWASMYKEFLDSLGIEMNKGKILDTMYAKALEGDTDLGGILLYNYHSGEHSTGFNEGRPLLTRSANGKLSFANLMKAQLYSAVSALKLGLDVLFNEEKVQLDKLYGHGGFFKAAVSGQRVMAACAGVPVSVMETAGEGGAWGMALLALFMNNKATFDTLDNFLNTKIFASAPCSEISPLDEDIKSFGIFVDRYKNGFAIERAAIENLK